MLTIPFGETRSYRDIALQIGQLEDRTVPALTVVSAAPAPEWVSVPMSSVDLTFNNWFNNPIQIDTTAGVSGDISNGWFDKGAPKAGGGAVLKSDSLSASRLPATMTGPQ